MNILSHEVARDNNPGLGMVVPTHNPNMQKAEVGRLPAQGHLWAERWCPLPLPSLLEPFCNINFCSFSEGTRTMTCACIYSYQSTNLMAPCDSEPPLTWVSCGFSLSLNRIGVYRILISNLLVNYLSRQSFTHVVTCFSLTHKGISKVNSQQLQYTLQILDAVCLFSP